MSVCDGLRLPRARSFNDTLYRDSSLLESGANPCRLRRAGSVLLAALALSLTACTTQPPPEPETEASLKSKSLVNQEDPWPHYKLARLYERDGRYEEALAEYGECINRLPARSATRPILQLGLLHHRLGNFKVARRCYAEVLDTFPTETSRYKTNPDYKVAARSTRAALVALEQDDEPDLKKRFIEEFGGDPATWEQEPDWLKPIPLKK